MLGYLMDILKQYEAKVLHFLLSRALSSERFEVILHDAKFISYKHTGSGYFLTLEHPSLPKARSVFSDPIVMGRAGDIACGFVVFIENGQLTLECHSWGEVDLPEGFRDKDVQIMTTQPIAGAQL